MVEFKPGTMLQSQSQQQSPRNQFKGMFGDGPGFNYNDNIFDLSGISSASNMLGAASPYSKTPLTASQFSPNPLQATSADKYKDIFNTSFKSGAEPIKAQSEERMRQMSQGFGAGNMSSGASKALQLKNAQETGRDLQGLSNNLSSVMAQNRLTNEQDVARYNTDQLFANQGRQADENYRVAGFGDQQSQFMANDALARAKQMFDLGSYVPNFQKDVYATGRGFDLQQSQLEQQAYQNMLAQYAALGQVGNNYG